MGSGRVSVGPGQVSAGSQRGVGGFGSVSVGPGRVSAGSWRGLEAELHVPAFG